LHESDNNNSTERDQLKAGPDSSASPTSVLVAEDDPIFRRLIESWLRKWNYSVIAAADGDEAWQYLQRPDAPKLLVLDWMMPGVDGIELCQRIRHMDVRPHPYTILLTANDRKDQIVHGLNSGADDYLVKPIDVNEFQARLHVGARTVALQDALFRKEQELRFAATHDTLTGLWNRGAMMEFLQRELAQGRRMGAPISLMMVDVDRFKLINDEHGHVVGDVVLQEIAERLRHYSRDNDWVGRYGGEEFMVVAGNCGAEGLPAFSERLRSCISDRPVETSAGKITTTISIGGLVVPPFIHTTCDSLVQVTDAALYCAKHAGRNRVELMRLSENNVPQTFPASGSGPHCDLTSLPSGR
jgi:diguanylate cyclase (GGDEF)-like protein